MIVSRCLTLGRLSTNVGKNLLVQNGKISIGQEIKRHSHKKYYYRCSPVEEPAGSRLVMELLGGVVWWWVLWHAFTDYHEILPYDLPDPSKWTDEELGIPPLDE